MQRPQRSDTLGVIGMARLKQRQAQGVCTTIEICQADVNGLVRRGSLDRMKRNDLAAVENAIGAVLDQLRRVSNLRESAQPEARA